MKVGDINFLKDLRVDEIKGVGKLGFLLLGSSISSIGQ